MRPKLDKSLLKDKRVLYGILVVVVVVICVAVAAMWGGKGDGDGNGGDNSDKVPVVAVAGPDIIGEAGKIIDFNASASTGHIAQYWWDFDSANATEPLVHEADGKAASHIFEGPGVYLVTLVVERKDGQSDNDTLTAFINLNQTVLDSVSTLQFSDNSTIAVKSEANRVALTLRFKTHNPGTTGTFNNLEMIVRDKSGQQIITSFSQIVNPTLEEQVKTLDVPLAQVVIDGEFTVEVQYIPTGILPRTVDYSLQVQVLYSF